MNTKQKYYVLLAVVLIIFPIMNSVSVVAQGADYVGINKNDSYMWDLTYDEDIDKDMGDDYGTNTTYFNIDDDVKAIKQVITWIGEEDTFGSDEGVKYKRNKYDSKKSGDVFGQGYNWKIEDKGGEFVILNYDSGDKSVINYYGMCAMWGAFFTANNVDWDEVVEELDDDLGSSNWASYRGNLITIGIQSTHYDIYIETEYTDDGILKYYRFRYDHEDIIKLELVNAFWIQYWVFVVIGIIALSAVIVVVIYFTAIRTSKEKVPPSVQAPAAKFEEKIPEGELICPSCGKKSTSGAKFCEYCGKTME